MYRVAMIPILIAAAHIPAAADSASQVSVYAITASRVIKVGEPATVSTHLSRRIEALRGWVVRQQPETIVARIPADSVEGLLTEIESLGLVLDRSYNRLDNTIEYWRLTAQVRAKRKLLGEYLQVLDSARSEAIYPVARGVTDVQRSIEEISGRIRGLEQRSAFAEVQVHFQFHDRRPPPATGASNFTWLNRVDMRLLIKDFR